MTVDDEKNLADVTLNVLSQYEGFDTWWFNLEEWQQDEAYEILRVRLSTLARINYSIDI